MNNYLLENLANLINIFGFFLFIIAAWLFFDADRLNSNRSTLIKSLGLFTISIGFISRVLISDMTVLQNLIFILGYVVFSIGLYKEKINPIPEDEKENSVTTKAIIPQAFIYFISFTKLFAVVSALILLYRRYTLGLVKEYRYLVLTFVFLTLAEIFSLRYIINDSTNVYISEAVKIFGLFWFVEHVLTGGALLFLTLWIAYYIRFRIYPTLFLGITSIVIVSTILSAFLYSIILINNSEKNYLDQLENVGESIQFTLNKYQESAQSSANLLSINRGIINGLKNNDLNSIYQITKVSSDGAQDIDSIIITDKAGVVVVHTDDPNQVGKSISNNIYVNRAVNYKEQNASVIKKPDLLIDSLVVTGVSPVLDEKNNVIGIVVTEQILDNSFADKLKNNTGLDVIIFTDNKRSATTFIAEDKTSRKINSEETSSQIKETVLNANAKFTGKTMIESVPYFASYSPIIDRSNNAIGMIFAGSPQELLISTVRDTNIKSFGLAILISVVSIVPGKILADYIFRNYRA